MQSSLKDELLLELQQLPQLKLSVLMDEQFNEESFIRSTLQSLLNEMKTGNQVIYHKIQELEFELANQSQKAGNVKQVEKNAQVKIIQLQELAKTLIEHMEQIYQAVLETYDEKLMNKVKPIFECSLEIYERYRNEKINSIFFANKKTADDR